jgi:uncharacterized membrane protein YfcA
LNPAEVILTLVIGLVSGVISGALGVGGGVVMVPAMVLLLGVQQAVAQGTSLSVMAIFTGAALATGGGAGRADTRRYGMLFLIAAALTVPVTIGGALARWRYSSSSLRTGVRRRG